MFRNDLKFLPINLQLFADGGGAGATGANAADAGQQSADGKENLENLENVVYGVHSAPEGQQQETEPKAKPSAADRNAEFEKLIKGEYKDLYDARVQETVKGRLKSSQQTVDRYNAMQPIIQELALRYGIQAGKDGSYDIAALVKAVEEDNAYFEAEAMQTGKTVDEIRAKHKREVEFRKMEAENAALKAQMEQTRAKENADRIYAGWMQEAEQIKKVYPKFDLKTEMRDPQFVRLLQANVNMLTAFQAIHQDEIMRGGMQYAVQQTAKQMTNKIMANGARPNEIGAGSSAAAITKSDPSALSDSDFDEIRKRVMRGERISFG